MSAGSKLQTGLQHALLHLALYVARSRLPDFCAPSIKPCMSFALARPQASHDSCPIYKLQFQNRLSTLPMSCTVGCIPVS